MTSTDHADIGLGAPEGFGLPTGYQRRTEPDYFAHLTDDGITCQPDVYPHAAQLAQHFVASGFTIHDAHATRSDDRSDGHGLSTQLVTAYPRTGQA